MFDKNTWNQLTMCKLTNSNYLSKNKVVSKIFFYNSYAHTYACSVGTGGDCLNYSIVEIGQNTEKSPGDLRRLAVKLQWKTISISWCEKLTRSKNNNESDGNTYCSWRDRYNHQKIGKGTEELEIRARVETIQTTALLRSSRILRRVLETLGDLLSLKLQWKTIS